MSKGKAKVASKNNPEGRSKAKEYFFNGTKIKPVKLITRSQSFLAAEYDGTGDLVLDGKGNPLPWSVARSQS